MIISLLLHLKIMLNFGISVNIYKINKKKFNYYLFSSTITNKINNFYFYIFEINKDAFIK